MNELPDAAYGAAMASLEGVGPRRLQQLLAHGRPPDAWASVVSGRHPADPEARWQADAAKLDVGAVWSAHRQRGIRVLLPDDHGYPAELARDPSAPAVLFARGELAAVEGWSRVAVVGTRTPTRYGLGVAAQFGTDLASTGVTVVSGLALGIDAAAHEGACAVNVHEHPGAAPPVGVVAGGLDVAYPARNTRLWERVVEHGVLLSESPVGAPPAKWRFLQRNRLLAAVSHVVVVVESHARGGSLRTADEALARGLPVGAVPGSIRSPASCGTNSLIADGCFPVRDVTDVLVAVDRARVLPPTSAGPPRTRADAPGAPSTDRHRRPQGSGPAPSSDLGRLVAAKVAEDELAPAGPSAAPSGAPTDSALGTARGDAASEGATATARVVLAALEWEACSLEQVLRRTGLGLAVVAAELERLEARGLVRGTSGWWTRS